MRLARRAQPRRVLLAHLYPEWDGVDIAAEAKKFWPGETIAARPTGCGLSIGGTKADHDEAARQ